MIWVLNPVQLKHLCVWNVAIIHLKQYLISTHYKTVHSTHLNIQYMYPMLQYSINNSSHCCTCYNTERSQQKCRFSAVYNYNFTPKISIRCIYYTIIKASTSIVSQDVYPFCVFNCILLRYIYSILHRELMAKHLPAELSDCKKLQPPSECTAGHWYCSLMVVVLHSKCTKILVSCLLQCFECLM